MLSVTISTDECCELVQATGGSRGWMGGQATQNQKNNVVNCTQRTTLFYVYKVK